MRRKVLFIVLGLLLVMQVFRPDRTAPAPDPADDMLNVLNAPADIRQLVTGACYDCHSYSTAYPWYMAITPVNFIMQDHIEEGREHLNFSLWSKYATGRHTHEAGEEVSEGEMPPGYYRLMHAHGRLSDADKRKLVAWFNANLGSEGGGREGHDRH